MKGRLALQPAQNHLNMRAAQAFCVVVGGVAMCNVVGGIEWCMAGLYLSLGEQAENLKAASEVDCVSQQVNFRGGRTSGDALPSLPDVLLN